MAKSNPTLQVDEILLRQWTREDARWYVESRDEEVFRWTTEKRDLTVRDTIESIRQANDAPDSFCFAIVDNDTEQLLGNIAIVRDPDNTDTGEIMFWLAPSGRGRGAAVRSTKLLCQWAFAELGLERITAKTLINNHRSQRILKKLGFDSDHAGDRGEQDRGYLWFAAAKQSFCLNP